MPALHKCRALLWAGFLAALLPSSVAMPHLQSQPRDLSMMSMDMSYTQDVYSKKLEADLPKDKPEEGEVSPRNDARATSQPCSTNAILTLPAPAGTQEDQELRRTRRRRVHIVQGQPRRRRGDGGLHHQGL